MLANPVCWAQNKKYGCHVILLVFFQGPLLKALSSPLAWATRLLPAAQTFTQSRLRVSRGTLPTLGAGAVRGGGAS